MEDMVHPSLKERINDLMMKSQQMFQHLNPYIPPPFHPSQSKKLKTKLETNFKVYERIKFEQTNKKSIRVSKNDAPLLLTNKESLSESEESKKVEDRLVSLPSQESSSSSKSSNALIARRTPVRVPEPKWHAPWELSAVVSGHLGWVRSIAFDPSNEWFATGAADRTIKIWDLAKCCAGVEGGLKLTLTGHISTVRGLAISSRHPYLFSVGEDKMVNCWDLEYNKIIRHYHGHLSGVFCLSLHPTLDLLITGGRDSVARVWDIRTKHQIHVLGGHSDAVSSILTNSVNPQVVTASHDSTIKLWDLVAGRAISTLTQHKKAVRGLCASQKEMSFISASADNIKKWQTRDGRFLSNFSGHNSVVNCVAANEDGVLVSCGDNGSMHFWDYETGYNFQTTKTIVQPGSLDAEAGIFAAEFDLSGSRLITCEADKSLKIWRENLDATEESHPIDMAAWSKHCLRLKRF